MIIKFDTYNESLRSKLKGKSEEEALISIKGLFSSDQFLKACQFGYLFLVKELLKKINWQVYNLSQGFQLASRNGHLDIVKELLKDNRVDPTDNNNYAIKNAYENGYTNIVKILLDNDYVKNKLTNNDMIKYENYINSMNESLKDKIKGKSDNELIKELDNLNDSDKIKAIIEYKLPYDLLPDNLTVSGNLFCSRDNNLTSLPDNLIVSDNLYCNNNDNLTNLPNNLIVKGHLDCSYNNLTSLPNNLIVNGNLFCSNNQLTSLPNDLKVNGNLYCNNNNLPKNIKKPIGVKGKIYYDN